MNLAVIAMSRQAPEIERVKIPVAKLLVDNYRPEWIDRVTESFKDKHGNDTSSRRYYETWGSLGVEDGSKLPSVTTVLGRVYPKDRLTEWRIAENTKAIERALWNRVEEPIDMTNVQDALDEAASETKQAFATAGRVGNKAHELVEMVLESSEWWSPPEPWVRQAAYRLAGGFNDDYRQLENVTSNLLDWVKHAHATERLEFIESEVCVYNHLFAGTVDALFQNPDGKIIVVDFKTANRVSILDNHKAQVAAYTGILQPYCSDIEGRIVQLRKNALDYTQESIDETSLEKWISLFNSAYEVYYELERI